jgi:predicted nuclease of predicted toxin-antitoxin system
MRLWLDAQLPPKLADWINQQGFVAEWITSTGDLAAQW